MLLLLVSIMSCSALVLPVHMPRTTASFSSARAHPSMGFEDSLAAMIDGVSAFFAKDGDKKPPVLAAPRITDIEYGSLCSA